MPYDAAARDAFVKSLNDAGVYPMVCEGEVTLVKEDDEGNEVEVALSEFNIIKGYVDEHPEGSDRGGFVPWVRLNDDVEAYHMENDGCWQ